MAVLNDATIRVETNHEPIEDIVEKYELGQREFRLQQKIYINGELYDVTYPVMILGEPNAI